MAKLIRLRAVFPAAVAAFVCLLLPGIAAAEKASCQPLQPDASNPGTKAYIVDQVWSGARVGFSSIASGDRIYSSYYDKDRKLTVAVIDLQKGQECRVGLPSIFGGWDSHNGTTLHFAPDGSLHLAANMHASAMVYGHTDSSGDIATMQLGPMVGGDEAHVTYPTFLQSGKEPLLFMYRSGKSGDGDWLLNRWEAGKWKRLGSVYSGDTKDGSVSAYPSNIERDSQGNYHVAVVWRKTTDVSTNYEISYGRTRDFLSWTSSTGAALPSPLSADSSDKIERPGVNSGLLNNARIVLDATGQPVIVYTRYGAAGTNAVFAAKPSGGHWKIKELVAASAKTVLSGGGSVAAAPRFNVENNGNVAILDYAFPSGPKGHLQLDLQTLTATPTDQATDSSYRPKLAKDSDGLTDPVPISVAINDQSGNVRGWLMWWAQAPNRDAPRACNSVAPLACNPPPKVLRLVLNSGGQQ